jgi:hypothetical protein
MFSQSNEMNSQAHEKFSQRDEMNSQCHEMFSQSNEKFGIGFL